jgi:hypothetical protein
MRPSLALLIGAAFYILAGLATLLAPAQLLSAAAWPTTPDVALVAARDSGTLLIVLGVIDWLARGAVGAPLRGLLWGNILRPVASLVVNGWEVAAGIIPATVFGGVALAAFGLDIALIVVFVLALRNAEAAHA